MGKELLLDDHRELRGEGRVLVGWIRASSEQFVQTNITVSLRKSPLSLSGQPKCFKVPPELMVKDILNLTLPLRNTKAILNNYGNERKSLPPANRELSKILCVCLFSLR